MADLVGGVLGGRYRVIARIASGGMGEVFRGHDLLLDRPVAIKVLQPSLARDPEVVARFRDEARAAARLQHPNVVAVHDWGEEDGTYFMVMEYVPGRDARDLLVARGALEPAQAADIVAAVCDALAAAHASALVHRDVKPENILIDRKGNVKVADFGIAAIVDAERTHPGGAVPGTLRYLAPEQALGREATPASDIWAAGAVLFELLTGRAVDHGGVAPAELLRRRASESVPPPSSLDPSVPQALDDIVARACAPHPADRFADAEEMAGALRRVAARALKDAPSVAELMADLTGEVRLADMDPTHVTRLGRRLAARRRRRARLVALMLVLASATGAAAAVKVLGAPAEVEVPEVVGLSLAEARARAEDAGLKVQSVAQAHLRAPEGEVLAQFPGAGTLYEGEVLRLVVSDGLPLRAVPDVGGMAEGAALARLRAAGFEPKTIARRYSQEPAGTVLAQRPDGGKKPWGHGVRLVVSRGPRPVAVPPVAGLALADARLLLRQAGFKVRLAEEYSDDVAEGRVIATDPPAAELAPKGSVVTVVVSLGARYKQFKLPDVTGMTVDRARARLEGLNLRVEVVRGEGSCADGNTVVETDPVAGTRVRERDLIALFVC